MKFGTEKHNTGAREQMTAAGTKARKAIWLETVDLFDFLIE